jgi:hypothetical protein
MQQLVAGGVVQSAYLLEEQGVFHCQAAHPDYSSVDYLFTCGDGEHDVLDYLKCDSEIHWALVAVCAKEFGHRTIVGQTTWPLIALRSDACGE